MDLALASDFVEMPAKDLADAETGRLSGLVKARTVVLNRHSDAICLYLDSDRHAGTRSVLLDVGQRGIQGMSQLLHGIVRQQNVRFDWNHRANPQAWVQPQNRVHVLPEIPRATCAVDVRTHLIMLGRAWAIIMARVQSSASAKRSSRR